MRTSVAAFRSCCVPALFSTAPLLWSATSRRNAFSFPGPSATPLRRRGLVLPFRLASTIPPLPPQAMSNIGSSSDSESAAAAAASLEKQFVEFHARLEESGSVRERIRGVVTEMETVIRLMQSSILLLHQSHPVPEVLGKAGSTIGVLKELFGRLGGILRGCPGQYYRYHGDWRSEAQTVVSLLAFLHWVETGNLLMHRDVEEKLGLDVSEFGLDIEDYLIGLCFMSNELPRYTVNRVTAGDYDCPRKVLKFLTELHTSFRMLNLRNDFLRKKFDSIKYDLRRVEEVFYDVKIRGLTSETSAAG
ncbi:unnamed protein product [Spirodela intermedia]|uniref:Uncharacterized protein n=1 Tax=Spirodela intermedia TaxID=51605 RepID=A0A7I8K1J2_SPIIN|nr:unnamed protein product [Spirodela intermedia]